MYVERQGRYPKGTYKVLFARQRGIIEYCMVNLYTGRQSRTSSISGMIKYIESDISVNRFPQSATQYRSWVSAAPAGKKPEVGKIVSIESARADALPELYGPTFMVQVLYLQNATWQGTIQWIEGRQTRQYRSVNELLKLMEEAQELSQLEAEDIDT